MKDLNSLAAWLQQETTRRKPRLDPTGVVRKTASVLLLLLPGPKGPELLFEVRSGKLNWQPGDICFPGGSRECTDRNFAAAAIREASEELGIRYEDVQLCGTLDFFAAHNGFMVYPFVGIWQPGGAGCNPLRPAAAELFSETGSVLPVNMSAKTRQLSVLSGTKAPVPEKAEEKKVSVSLNCFTMGAAAKTDICPQAVNSRLDYRNWHYNKDEVAELFTVPLRHLLEIEPLVGTAKVTVTKGHDFPFDLLPHLDPEQIIHKDYPVYFYTCERHVVWGMTAAILHSFLMRFGKGLSDFA